ncbi:protein of unknown function UPF0153 [Gloeothece citriformis PCC 7424]|uniref:YkgJ family cysteine cluster protein n=1 Tax=Gloeothece citriformis (strain PCC 7424) TaxID=65393 RepID=B7KK71_GLOC7|nr:YkgJ family cysteine cluster protein [Gloeothece citriformis]ACK70956.1 protein of unknown function UPF0153 [Gloeothece citriformis PCC 7424]
MTTWRCVTQCGACCHLQPGDRPELEDYLTPEELRQYLSLVGEDGWCVHFDHSSRKCTIYEQRPLFCRVTPENFKRMYAVEAEEFNEFAIDCCQQQIEAVYGEESPEIDHYNQEIGF